jgi:hypothetical protein
VLCQSQERDRHSILSRGVNTRSIMSQREIDIPYFPGGVNTRSIMSQRGNRDSIWHERVTDFPYCNRGEGT